MVAVPGDLKVFLQDVILEKNSYTFERKEGADRWRNARTMRSIHWTLKIVIGTNQDNGLHVEA